MKVNNMNGYARSEEHLSRVDYPEVRTADFMGFGLDDVLRLLRRWWWVIASFIIASLLLTFYFVSKVTPVYLATSSIEVKQQERQIFSQESEVESFVVDSEFFDTQIQLLQSKTLAGDIVDQFNLTSDPEFSSLEENSRDAKRRLAVEKFSSKLGVAAVGRSRLIKVSFEHTNPNTAAKIANAITDSFITYNLERKYNATSYARDFIEDRLKTTKDILETSERELVEYAADNNLVNLSDGQGNVSAGLLESESLIALNAELLNARTKRIETELKYNIAETQ